MQVTTEQAQFLQQFFCGLLEEESKTAQRVIAAIPADKCSYKPHPASKSAFELAEHLALSETGLLNGAATGTFDFSQKLPESVKTPADLAKWYGETTQKTLATLRALTPSQLVSSVDFFGRMQMPAVMYISLAINHSIHHRGQLSTYIRPMGSKVPSIYGPTYEDEIAAKSAQV